MSCEGQIMAALNDDTQEVTPLQMKLDVIANDIGKLGMYAAILIFHWVCSTIFLTSGEVK